MGRALVGVLVGLLLSAGAGCSGRGRVPMPSLDPQVAGQQALSDYDANRDGFLDAAELGRCPGLKAALGRIDKDRDGRLTAAEIATRLVKYQEDKVALTFVIGQVVLDGKPLSGAEITLVPESFMGAAVKPARSLSDAGGMCAFQTEGQEVPGVHSGIFRIRVSKKDADGKETLPARYNHSTTLGTEVSMGQQTLSINLKSR
jgi:hypothetical protein